MGSDGKKRRGRSGPTVGKPKPKVEATPYWPTSVRTRMKPIDYVLTKTARGNVRNPDLAGAEWIPGTGDIRLKGKHGVVMPDPDMPIPCEYGRRVGHCEGRGDVIYTKVRLILGDAMGEFTRVVCVCSFCYPVWSEELQAAQSERRERRSRILAAGKQRGTQDGACGPESISSSADSMLASIDAALNESSRL